jgi:hypothetical protein
MVLEMYRQSAINARSMPSFNETAHARSSMRQPHKRTESFFGSTGNAALPIHIDEYATDVEQNLYADLVHHTRKLLACRQRSG